MLQPVQSFFFKTMINVNIPFYLPFSCGATLSFKSLSQFYMAPADW